MYSAFILSTVRTFFIDRRMVSGRMWLQIGMSGWLTGDYSLRCQPVDYSNRSEVLRVGDVLTVLSFVCEQSGCCVMFGIDFNRDCFSSSLGCGVDIEKRYCYFDRKIDSEKLRNNCAVRFLRVHMYTYIYAHPNTRTTYMHY